MEVSMKARNRILGCFAALALPMLLPVASAMAAMPTPVLYLTGVEYYSAAGGNFVRYRYDVLNKTDFSADLFTPAPGLPPCGLNANSSRAWVDFFDQRGKRLYGFCALGSPSNLGSIWFATPEGTVPPSYIYIEINDRQTNTKVRSNLADTSM
jgi:hypothetical protein